MRGMCGLRALAFGSVPHSPFGREKPSRITKVGIKGRAVGAGRRRGKYRFRDAPGGKCGPVTVTHSDGSVDVLPALSAQQVRVLIRERLSISAKMRDIVLRRDRGACRYCQRSDLPLEVDHVVPVALGGTNRIGNLVTSCDCCNRRKGANVWTPKPLAVHRARLH
jgi:5-methylcytosine-specific restriction endonuclease McrA